MYHNFANLFSKFLESTFYKEIALKVLDYPFCEGFPNSAAHTS